MTDQALDVIEPTEVFPPLPGLELSTDARDPGRLEASARRSLAALHKAKLVDESDAALMDLFLTLARTVDRAANAHNVRASSVAMAAKEMRECWAMLNPPDDGSGGTGDAFEQVAAAIAALAASGRGA